MIKVSKVSFWNFKAFVLQIKDGDISEMPGSSCMDFSLVGAALVWFLTGFRLEQVVLQFANILQEEYRMILNFQATIWFCVFYAIGFALT